MLHLVMYAKEADRDKKLCRRKSYACKFCAAELVIDLIDTVTVVTVAVIEISDTLLMSCDKLFELCYRITVPASFIIPVKADLVVFNNRLGLTGCHIPGLFDELMAVDKPANVLIVYITAELMFGGKRPAVLVRSYPDLAMYVVLVFNKKSTSLSLINIYF